MKMHLLLKLVICFIVMLFVFRGVTVSNMYIVLYSYILGSPPFPVIVVHEGFFWTSQTRKGNNPSEHCYNPKL